MSLVARILRIFGRQPSSADAADAVILTAPIGKKIWDLNRDSLRTLLFDMKASSPSEDPIDTIMRYLGGDVVSDLEEEFGTPERRQMTRTKDGHIVITLIFPKSLWKRTSVSSVSEQAQRRLVFRY